MTSSGFKSLLKFFCLSPWHFLSMFPCAARSACRRPDIRLTAERKVYRHCFTNLVWHLLEAKQNRTAPLPPRPGVAHAPQPRTCTCRERTQKPRGEKPGLEGLEDCAEEVSQAEGRPRLRTCLSRPSSPRPARAWALAQRSLFRSLFVAWLLLSSLNPVLLVGHPPSPSMGL